MESSAVAEAHQLRQRVRELEQANDKIVELNAVLQRRVDEATAERASLAKVEELDRLKSQFMSLASHELKTPVTAMSGFLQVVMRRVEHSAKRGMSDPKTWEQEQLTLIEQLDIVKRQTSKLARLIDELLDVSRIQSGRIAFQHGDVDLTKLALEVAERMQLTTQKHTVRVHAAESLSLVGDHDHLEQVLNNLVANAIKYSPDGGSVNIHVEKDADGALVRVRDGGIGIAKEELDAVFGLFYRSPDRVARDVGGMGLGLYISKGIVDRHGGRIWAESERGKGSTFHVWLPREARQQSASVEDEGEPASAPG